MLSPAALQRISGHISKEDRYLPTTVEWAVLSVIFSAVIFTGLRHTLKANILRMTAQNLLLQEKIRRNIARVLAALLAR